MNFNFNSSIKYCVLLLGLILIYIASYCFTAPLNKASSYAKQRFKIIKVEDERMTGGHLKLNDKEIIVDEIIKKLKHQEIEKGYYNHSAYAPALHFFQAKPLIEKSKVFDIIKMIPKGAALHLHNSASVSTEWIIRNLTYQKEAVYCQSKKGFIIFSAGDLSKCTGKATNIVQERANKSIDEIHKYDIWLGKQLNMYTETPNIDFPDQDAVWDKFQSLFYAIDSLITYEKFARDYHYRMLEELYHDGVYYVELRTSLKELHSADGTKTESAKMLQEVVKDFAISHPDFIGLKAIYTIYRNFSKNQIQQKVKEFTQMQKSYPKLLIGFDFVGQEEIVSLLDIKNTINKFPKGIKLFLHAGETNWWGTPADMNLIDAILMNTTRIGHGYALLKHPALLDMVIKRNIAIEVSVISNQVLHLVSDLRNHPAAIYLALNLPVIITNDDPSFWNAKGMSYDWYLAFMAISPLDAGLKLLKQLALNAIKYSILTQEERQRYSLVFDEQWDIFLNNVIQKYR